MNVLCKTILILNIELALKIEILPYGTYVYTVQVLYVCTGTVYRNLHIPDMMFITEFRITQTVVMSVYVGV